MEGNTDIHKINEAVFRLPDGSEVRFSRETVTYIEKDRYIRFYSYISYPSLTHIVEIGPDERWERRGKTADKLSEIDRKRISNIIRDCLAQKSGNSQVKDVAAP